MTDALVRVDDVRKEYGKLVAVDGVSLRIESGEFFSLLGPSGCGKTTCLRMISGFETPTDGKVLIEGRDVTGKPPNKRSTNMVFQHLSLFPHLTVGENIQYGLKKSGVGPEEREERVARILELVDMSGFQDRNPTELSGGQQQRVALARALVNNPDVLLLDEPLSGLDRKLRQHMQVELAKIQREVDGAFFYVTHDQEVAMTLSDRLAIMNDGVIQQVGAPEEIYNDPANEFVADFIGDTNLLEGTAENANPSGKVFLEGVSDPIWESTAIDATGGVTLSVRPESVHLHKDDRGVLTGKIVDRFFQGDHVEYIVSSPAESVPELDVTHYETDQTFREGETVTISFEESGVVLFERDD